MKEAKSSEDHVDYHQLNKLLYYKICNLHFARNKFPVRMFIYNLAPALLIEYSTRDAALVIEVGLGLGDDLCIPSIKLEVLIL